MFTKRLKRGFFASNINEYNIIDCIRYQFGIVQIAMVVIAVIGQLHFCGQTAHQIQELPYVVDADSNVFQNLILCHNNSGNIELYSTAMLHLLLSQLLQSPRRENDYITIVKNYIHTHYNGKINIAQLQKLVNLNRQYLSSLFHQRTGMTLQQYIRQTRIEKAKLLLLEGYSVTETAELCGYANLYAFSKAFKETIGRNPSSYRQKSR